MGTAIVIDVRATDLDHAQVEHATAAAFDHFRAVDRRFSTYIEDSEVSRYNAGEIALGDVSDELREVLELCKRARQASDGYFDIRGHRTDGKIDPSGLVKGWSVDGAARLLDAAGLRNYCVNAAGDIVARDES